MHWSYYILIAAAIAAAHFGGARVAGPATRHRWSFSRKSILAIAIGIPCLVALAVLLKVEAPLSTLRALPLLLGFSVYPILRYAGLRVKKALYPGLKWYINSPPHADNSFGRSPDGWGAKRIRYELSPPRVNGGTVRTKPVPPKPKF